MNFGISFNVFRLHKFYCNLKKFSFVRSRSIWSNFDCGWSQSLFTKNPKFLKFSIKITFGLKMSQFCQKMRKVGTYTVWPKSDVPKSDAFLKYSKNSSKFLKTRLKSDTSEKWRIFENFVEPKISQFWSDSVNWRDLTLIKYESY